MNIIGYFKQTQLLLIAVVGLGLLLPSWGCSQGELPDGTHLAGNEGGGGSDPPDDPPEGPPGPEVAFSSSGSSGVEAVTNVNITVALSESCSWDPITVDYSVTGGAATGGGEDYTLASGTLTFNPTETSQVIALAVVEDARDEDPEPLTVELSNLSGCNASLGARTTYTYTILDNDAPPMVAFDAASANGAEGTSPANLAVSLSSASGKPVTVDYAVTAGTATGGGTDYLLSTGTLTFNPGQSSKNISIFVVDDILDEANESVEITLSNPSNASLGANSVHTYTILDDDLPPTVQFAVASSSAIESSTPALVSVTLTAPSAQTITVDYDVGGGSATGGGTDYTLASGTLTFNPSELSKDISIAVVDDGASEADETVDIQLSNPANVALGAQASHTYSILDNDGVVQLDLASSSGSESSTSVNLGVSLAAAKSVTITVDYAVTGGTATGGGTDYTLVSGTLTFNPTETSKSVSLSVVNDLTDEEDETVVVGLSNASNATLGANSSHTYTIQDNDANPAVSFDLASSSGSEGATPVVLQVSLDAPSAKTVTVDYAVTGGTATGGGADYTLASGTLTFASGDVSESISLAIVDDSADEPDESVIVTLSNPSEATLGSAPVHTYTIQDDDTAPTVVLSSGASNPTNLSPFSVTATFSEDVTGFDAGDISVGNGSVSNFSSMNGSVYTFDVTPSGDGAVTVDVPASACQNAGGTGNSAAIQLSRIYDGTAPSVVVTSTESSPTHTSPIPMSATFNENVTGFAVGDLVVGNGTASNFSAVSGSVYTFDVTPLASGVVTVDINAAAAQDAVGNPSQAATQFSINYGLTAVLAISDGATYDFGTHNVGDWLQKSFTISNTGDGPATSLSGSGLAAPFSFKGGSYPGTSGTCDTTLAASSNCTIVVVFNPSNAGSFSDTVQISYDDGWDAQSVIRDVSGTANAVAPTKLGFNAPSAVTVSACQSISIQSLTAAGIPSAVSSNTTVNLAVNNGSGTYYSNATCTTTVASRTIPNGQSSVSFYFKSPSAPQNLTLVATSASLSSTSHALNVGSTPTALWISGAPSFETDECGALTISRIDTYGNPMAAAGAVTVDLSQDMSGAFYSAADCSGGSVSSVAIDAGNASTQVYFKDSVSENVTLTASDAASVLIDGNKSVSIVPGTGWWDDDWSKRILLTISNLDQSTAFTNMPVLVKLDLNRIDYDFIQSNGQDLRFVASDQTTVLAHEIEKWNPSGDSYVWVRVPSILASTDSNYIYLYFGNPSAPDGQSASSVWNSYWGVWHLGSSLVDSTGGGLNGSLENGASITSGRIGDGADVSGNNDTVVVASDLSPVLGRTSTFSAWMKTNQVGNNTMWQAPGITGVEASGNGNDIFFGWIDASGYIGVTAGNGATAKSNFVVNDNTWRHVSITRNETTGIVQFFINGVLNGSGTSETGSKTSAFQRFGIIGDTGGTPVELDGLLDEIRIYNSVQSTARIRADYKYMADTHVSYGQIESAP